MCKQCIELNRIFKMTKSFGEGTSYLLFFLISLAIVPFVYAEENVQVIKEFYPDKSIVISTGDSILIEMNNVTLQDALEVVTIKSKIKFEVPANLLKDKITFRSNSRDWPEAIKKMLKQYNVAYGWEEIGLKTVFIFERGTGEVLQLIPDPMDDLPSLGQTEPNQHASDTSLDEKIFQSIPPIPTEDEKIIEMKFGTQRLGMREEKPDLENDDELLKRIPVEASPDLPNNEIENTSDFSEQDEMN